MKFLCDEMLQRLGSWLRAAGYDTFIENQGRSDYELLKQAIAEQRYLITRDRKLVEHRRAPGTVVLIECDGLEECVEALTRTLAINWLYKPFIRCMVCNTPLSQAEDEHLVVLPKQIQTQLQTPMYCPTCKKVYWEGGHVHRMRDRLSQWQGRYSAKYHRNLQPAHHRAEEW